MLRQLIVALLISSILGLTYKIFSTSLEAHTEKQFRPTYTLELVVTALACILGALTQRKK